MAGSESGAGWSPHLSSSGFALSLGTFLSQQGANPALWGQGWDSFQAQQHGGDGDRCGACMNATEGASSSGSRR